ncbi:MAG: class I SAM-dependent methyltransferase [Pseudonocardiaceae bacterium]
MSEISGHVQSGKAQFGHVYNLVDPRGYFQALRDMRYQAPAHGERVFTHLVQRRRAYLDQDDVVVLDLCCSYGVNAALLNHDLTLDDLYARYGSLELAALSAEELAVADRAFYGERRRPCPVHVVGVDVADQAISYAQRVGLHWAGSSANLENEEPSAALAHHLAGVDLITVTGGIGYITERTFDRVLQCVSPANGCWVAVFALRWISYERIAEILARYGLVTEQLCGQTFRQRRFADDAERDYVLDELERMGVDPVGKETEGWYHSNFYFSRPVEHNLPPLRELLSGYLD